jgi:hypothetical protein
VREAPEAGVDGVVVDQGVEGERLSIAHGDGQRRHLLVEQPTPGARPGGRLLGEKPLLGLGHPVGSAEAHDPQPVGEALERRIGEQALGAGPLDRDPLQLEEGDQGLDADHRRLGLGEQRAVLGRLGVGVEAQQRVRVGGGQRRQDALQLLAQPGQLPGVAPGDAVAMLSGEALRERDGLAAHR